MLEILSVSDISNGYTLLREFPKSWDFLSRTNEAGTLVIAVAGSKSGNGWELWNFQYSCRDNCITALGGYSNQLNVMGF